MYRVLFLCVSIASTQAVNNEGYRYKRQLGGSFSSNPNGGVDLNLAAPLHRTDSGTFAALGSATGFKGSGFNSASGGLAYLSDKGNAATLTGSHLPGFGNQLTGAGKVNLVNSGPHKVDASAFATRTFPNSNTGLANFNTYGGNAGYNFNDKIGASLGAAHTPLFQKTDVSAMSTLNLFRSNNRALDFSAGASRSFSPYIPKSSWEPTFKLGLTQRF